MLEQVGEAPRATGSEPELETPERLFAEKYTGVSTFQPDGDFVAAT